MTKTHRHCSGEKKSKTYIAWIRMKDRCTNMNSGNWENYGGRGITIYERWLYSFESFLEDLGVCPEGYSLERDDNNGNYEPSNCRWIPLKEQGLNKRDTVYVEYKGERIALAKYCRENGLNPKVVYTRIHWRKWTVERAIEQPLRRSGHRHAGTL